MDPIDAPLAPDVLRRVRPQVRRARAYHVGGVPDVPAKLNQNESPFDLPGDVKQVLVDALLDVPANRYPTEQPDALRDAIAARIGVRSDAVLVGNGSNELTYTIGLTLVGTNAPVVLPRPMFALFTSMTQLFGGTVVPVAPRDDLSFDVDGILAAQRRTDAALTVVATPNNPTGLALEPSDVERIVADAPGIVLVDEAYVEFSPHGSLLPLLERHQNVMFLRTLSKAYGLAGYRLGYLVAHPELTGELLKARLPFMVDRVAERVGMALVARPDLVDERVAAIRASIGHLVASLDRMPGVEALPTSTNFVLFRTPVAPEVLMDRLVAEGVLVRSMGGYPELQGYLRVSAGTEPENRLFLTALHSAIVQTD